MLAVVAGHVKASAKSTLEHRQGTSKSQAHRGMSEPSAIVTFVSVNFHLKVSAGLLPVYSANATASIPMAACLAFMAVEVLLYSLPGSLERLAGWHHLFAVMVELQE